MSEFTKEDNGDKNSDYTIQAAEEEQKQFKSKLDEITSGSPENKSDDQLDKTKNVRKLYKK